MRPLPRLSAAVSVALLAAPIAGQESAPFTEWVRVQLEQRGRPLTRLDCPVQGALRPGDVVDCAGEDVSGAHRRATVLVEENGGARLRSVSSPWPEPAAGQIDPFDAACRAVVAAYNAEDWDALMSPREAADPLASGRLRGMRAATGPVEPAPPHSVTVMGPLVQLEYTLAGAAGPYEFRCGFPVQSEAGEVNDWILAAPRGAPYGAPLLLADMRRQLSALLGRAVERVDLPVERLRRVGDWVEARVHFAEGGPPLTVGVEVTGRDDDFDGGDYAATQLALERVIPLHFPAVASVACPVSVLPDGGEGECTARFPGGRERTLWARRDGLEHTVGAPPLATGVDTADRGRIAAALDAGLEREIGADVSAVRCDYSAPYGPRAELECAATLASGENVTVVVFVAGDRVGLSLVTRDAASLTPDLRAELEPSCTSWLTAYDRKAWGSLPRLMVPDLREQAEPEAMRRLAADVGDAESWTLESHSVRGGLRHELAYRLETDRGSWTFRCALALAGEGAPQIEGYHLQPAPGSPTEVEALHGTALQAYSSILGEPVQSVELPFEELAHWRAIREGVVRLADGRSFAVRAERTGRPDDFGGIDHSFHVIDVPFVLRRTFAERSEELTAVACPRNVVGDAEQVVCRVETATGARLDVTALRHGSRYQLQTRPVEE